MTKTALVHRKASPDHRRSSPKGSLPPFSLLSPVWVPTFCYFCVEFEASSPEPAGYPIAVALAQVATGKVMTWLIRPTPIWRSRGAWSEESAARHGITRARLEAEGVPVQQVAAELGAMADARAVFSDDLARDGRSLRDLYAAIGATTPPFSLRDFLKFEWDAALRTGRIADEAIAEAEAAADIKHPLTGRAGAAACHKAEVLRRLMWPG